jgi:hypothetical protein
MEVGAHVSLGCLEIPPFDSVEDKPVLRKGCDLAVGGCYALPGFPQQRGYLYGEIAEDRIAGRLEDQGVEFNVCLDTPARRRYFLEVARAPATE